MAATRVGAKRKITFDKTREIARVDSSTTAVISETDEQLTQTLSLSSSSSDCSTTEMYRQLSAGTINTLKVSPAKKAKIILANAEENFNELMGEIITSDFVTQISGKKELVARMILYVGEIYRLSRDLENNILFSPHRRRQNANKIFISNFIIDSYSLAAALNLKAATTLLNEYRYHNLRLYFKSLRNQIFVGEQKEYADIFKEICKKSILAKRQQKRTDLNVKLEELNFHQQDFVRNFAAGLDSQFKQEIEAKLNHYPDAAIFNFLTEHLHQHLKEIINCFSTDVATQFILCLTYEMGLVFIKNNFCISGHIEQRLQLGRKLIEKAAKMQYSPAVIWLRNNSDNSLTLDSETDTEVASSQGSADTVEIKDDVAEEAIDETGYQSDDISVSWNRDEIDLTEDDNNIPPQNDTTDTESEPELVNDDNDSVTSPSTPISSSSDSSYVYPLRRR